VSTIATAGHSAFAFHSLKCSHSLGYAALFES